MTWVWYLDVRPVQQPVDQHHQAGRLQNRLHLSAFRRLPVCTGKRRWDCWIWHGGSVSSRAKMRENRNV